jgi:hypothetical protein
MEHIMTTRFYPIELMKRVIKFPNYKEWPGHNVFTVLAVKDEYYFISKKHYPQLVNLIAD